MNEPYRGIHISEAFKTKIRSVFPNGEIWLRELPELIEYCVEKWNLSSLEIPSALYYNFISFAQSAQYGPVVLKIGVPHEDLYVQMDSIAFFNSEYVCRLHAVDKELGAVLLERITPGHDLTLVTELSERADIAGELIKNIPTDIGVASRFPTFRDWLDTAFAKVKKNRSGHGELLRLAEEANRLFNFLPSNASQQRLLHGDLHHFNIIFDQQHNKWKAIDPHGVTGYFGLECGRFINNQMGMEADENGRHQALQILAETFGEKLALSPKTITTCAFIDTVMSTCWTTEEVTPNEQDINDGIAYANIILSYLR